MPYCQFLSSYSVWVNSVKDNTLCRACFLWQGQKDSPVCGARNSLTLSFARRISTAAPAFASLFPLFAALANAPHDTLRVPSVR